MRAAQGQEGHDQEKHLLVGHLEASLTPCMVRTRKEGGPRVQCLCGPSSRNFILQAQIISGLYRHSCLWLLASAAPAVFLQEQHGDPPHRWGDGWPWAASTSLCLPAPHFALPHHEESLPLLQRWDGPQASAAVPARALRSVSRHDERLR